jgi:hypothetical protein
MQESNPFSEIPRYALIKELLHQFEFGKKKYVEKRIIDRIDSGGF